MCESKPPVTKERYVEHEQRSVSNATNRSDCSLNVRSARSRSRFFSDSGWHIRWRIFTCTHWTKPTPNKRETSSNNNYNNNKNRAEKRMPKLKQQQQQQQKMTGPKNFTSTFVHTHKNKYNCECECECECTHTNKQQSKNRICFHLVASSRFCI